jgi:hypothetical protein
MRRLFAASLVLFIVMLALAACGPVPQRQWPVWTNGDFYNNLDHEPGAR